MRSCLGKFISEFVLHYMMFLLAYNDRYKDKEKYVISASGDSFFMVDDSRYYFDELSGSKHLR